MKQTKNKYYNGALLFFALNSILISGCATYHPTPLPTEVNLVSHIDQLLDKKTSDEIIKADGLSLLEIARIAVRNNPDLKAQRKRLGVARAQLYSTRLLPDPQLSASLELPDSNQQGVVTAFGLGLDYDIMQLINRNARIDSDQQALLQTRLEVLWQEWQVSQRAQCLAIRLNSQHRQISLLREMHDLYLQRYEHSCKALEQGSLSLDVTGTDLTALMDTLSEINQLEQECNESSHALNLLLGLDPNVSLTIRLQSPLQLPDAKTLQSDIKGLPTRRPDLLALQAGYLSQEARVRAAVLSQFPSVSIGVSRLHDNGDIAASGFNIGLNLPLFSGNRGAIKIERATREQLKDEYQARLDQALVDVNKLIHLQSIVATEQEKLEEYLPTLNKLVTRGRDAYQRGDIDSLTFLNMETTWIRKRQEKISLDQIQRENIIALQILLALPKDGNAKQKEILKGEAE